MYTLPYVKKIAGVNFLYDIFCDNLDGWGGEGGRREVRREGHMYSYN